jgi:protein CpxP
MKKIILSLVAVMMAAGAYAHDTSKVKRSPEEMANRKADKLKTELGLNDDQRGKVYSVFLDKINKSEAIRAKYKDSKDKKAMKAEMKTVEGGLETSLKGILTPEQYTKWQTLREEKKQQHKEKKDNKPASGTP